MIDIRELFMYVALGGLVATLAVLALMWIGKGAAKYVEQVGRNGRISQFLALAATVMLIVYAGTKPTKPVVTWDSGLHDNGTSFDTNTWASITFKWTKDSFIPNTDPLFFALKEKDAGADIMPVDIGETTAGALTWSYSFTGGENATNYLYYAYLGGSVHTNGVWLGNILIKQYPGDNGIDKMVIIRGKLNVNGVQKAPPQN